MPGHPDAQRFYAGAGIGPAVNTNSRDRQIAEDIRRVLNLYAQGEQAALLNGVTNFTVDRDIFCIHMGLVGERKEVLALLLLLYRDFAYRKAVYLPGEMPPFLGTASIDWMFAAQKRPKLLSMDEFHNLKDNEPILDVLDKDARQQRTLGLATYIVTQDIPRHCREGKAFHICRVQQVFHPAYIPGQPDHGEHRQYRTNTGLGRQERDLLISLKFHPGRYAEILALNEDIGKGVSSVSRRRSAAGGIRRIRMNGTSGTTVASALRTAGWTRGKRRPFRPRPLPTYFPQEVSDRRLTSMPF